jgi:hypothetical protein
VRRCQTTSTSAISSGKHTDLPFVHQSSSLVRGPEADGSTLPTVSCRVSRYQGLFYFDSSFRPVPLEQHFLGIKGKNQSPAQKKNMDEVVFEKVRQLVLLLLPG